MVASLCGFVTHSGYVPWSVVETVLTLLFPNHTVCSGQLTDDSGWMAPAAGVAFYDLISIGRATWVDRTDTAGRGTAQGCGRPDHGDDCEHHDDHNHDHDDEDDDEDRDWKRKHDHDD